MTPRIESAVFGLVASVAYLGARLACSWAPLTPDRTASVAAWMLEEIGVSAALTSAVLWYLIVARRNLASPKHAALVGVASALLSPICQALLHMAGVRIEAVLADTSTPPLGDPPLLALLAVPLVAGYWFVLCLAMTAWLTAPVSVLVAIIFARLRPTPTPSQYLGVQEK